jgi:hypothetical protein
MYYLFQFVTDSDAAPELFTQSQPNDRLNPPSIVVIGAVQVQFRELFVA